MSSTITVRSDAPPRRTETGPRAGTISAASGARHRELPARQRRCRSSDPTVTKAAFGRDGYIHFAPMLCKPRSRYPGAFTADIRTRSPETHRPFSGLTHYKEADNRQSVCRRRSEDPRNAGAARFANVKTAPPQGARRTTYCALGFRCGKALYKINKIHKNQGRRGKVTRCGN